MNRFLLGGIFGTNVALTIIWAMSKLQDQPVNKILAYPLLATAALLILMCMADVYKRDYNNRRPWLLGMALMPVFTVPAYLLRKARSK